MQSTGGFARPWCLIELATAIDNQIPIVGVSLTSGKFAYSFAAASSFLKGIAEDSGGEYIEVK